VDVLPVAAGERSGGEDLAGESDEKDAKCCRKQGENVSRPQTRQFDTGKTGGNMADDGHSLVG
jgi:hypothetical protein